MNTQEIKNLINEKINLFSILMVDEKDINKQAFYRAKISALNIALNHIQEGIMPDILNDLEYKELEKIP